MKTINVPQGKYKSTKRIGNIVYTSGMTPRRNGRLVYKGTILKDGDFEVYRSMIRLVMENIVNSICYENLKSSSIVQFLSMNIYLVTEDGFEDHSKIADYASEYLFELYGDRGVPVRTVVGVQSLPKNAPVEIQVIAEIKNDHLVVS